MIPIILKSLLLGLIFTLPVGPIGIFCVRKILQLGRLYGFVLGLSQVFVIFIYSIIAIISLGWFLDFIMKYQFWFQLFGGLVLMGFGIKIFISKNSAIVEKHISKKGFITDLFSIAELMLISPQTLLIFLVFYAALGLHKATTFFQQIEVIFGVLIGSCFSWSLVCVCFAGYKTKTTQKVMAWINRSVGFLLVGFGIAVCISAILLVT